MVHEGRNRGKRESEEERHREVGVKDGETARERKLAQRRDMARGG